MTCSKCHGLMVPERDAWDNVPHWRCLNCGKYLVIHAPHPVYGPADEPTPARPRKPGALTLAERKAAAAAYQREYYHLRRAKKYALGLCSKCSRLRLPDSSFCHAHRESNRRSARAAWREKHQATA